MQSGWFVNILAYPGKKSSGRGVPSGRTTCNGAFHAFCASFAFAQGRRGRQPRVDRLRGKTQRRQARPCPFLPAHWIPRPSRAKFTQWVTPESPKFTQKGTVSPLALFINCCTLAPMTTRTDHLSTSKKYFYYFTQKSGSFLNIIKIRYIRAVVPRVELIYTRGVDRPR